MSNFRSIKRKLDRHDDDRLTPEEVAENDLAVWRGRANNAIRAYVVAEGLHRDANGRPVYDDEIALRSEVQAVMGPDPAEAELPAGLVELLIAADCGFEEP